MANFLDFINKKAAAIQTGGEDEREPEPKGGYLTFPPASKNGGPRELKLRILPSLEFIQGTEQDPTTFGEMNQRIFFTTPHQTTAGRFATANWNTKDDQETLALINRWTQEGKMNGRFGVSRPRREYLINVLELDANNNTTGEVKVYRAPQSVYNKLIGLLQDQDTWFEGSQLGWLDPNVGSSVKITRDAENNYDVRLSNRPLPAIDWNAVAPQMEPLSNFTKPSRITGSDYFKQVVAWMDEIAEAPVATQAPVQPVQPVQPTFNQPAFTQPQQPQAPVQPAQPTFNQPTFNQPAVAQPQAPVQPAQPAFTQPSVQAQPAFQQAPTVDPNANPFASATEPQGPATGNESLDAELANILSGNL